jgi:preprotein translocase subunit SecF
VILVFFFFRSIPPSVAVLTGALADIVIALGAMGMFGIPLTLASFAALLMLIGYSLDTDILLTTRILKRKGDPRENAFDAMKTGLTMSVTGLIAFTSLFVLSVMTHIPTYFEISGVALAGLVGDMFATWGINAVLVLHFAHKRDD